MLTKEDVTEFCKSRGYLYREEPKTSPEGGVVLCIASPEFEVYETAEGFRKKMTFGNSYPAIVEGNGPLVLASRASIVACVSERHAEFV